MKRALLTILSGFLLFGSGSVLAESLNLDQVGQSDLSADCSDVPLFSISAFSPSSAQLPESSEYLLELVADSLAGKDCIMTVTGYGSIGFDGSARESFVIALERAQATVGALVNMGVKASHLLPESEGAVTTFGTPASNRRVTVAFTPERGYRCSLIADNPAPDLNVTVASFASGSTKLDSGAMLDIATFATLENRPECHLVIKSFTSVEGSDSENENLALGRAKSILGALVDQGISGSRVSTLPMGPTEAFGEDLSSNRRALLGYR